MEPTKDNSYCHYPFKQLAISYWNAQGIQCVNPCCNMASPLDPDPLKTNQNIHNNVAELYNLSQLAKVREQMLAGKYPDACKVCYDAEKYGTSPRLMLDTTSSNKLEWLDIHLGNKCNLRCRMCHPALSNQLNKDADAFEKDGFKYWWQSVPDITPHDISVLFPVLNQITNIRVSGGEPLLSEEYLTLLDYCIENDLAKNITLELHTNATKFTNKNVNRLNKFKHVNVTFSIDGTRKIYEYIRFPFSFDILENNVNNFFNKVKKSTVQINYVATIYNVFDIRNTMLWAKKFNISDFVITNVFPKDRNIDICWMPVNYLVIAREMILGLGYQTENFEKYIAECIQNNKYNKDKLKTVKEEIIQFDKNRNQDYKDYLDPLVVRLLDSL
jgi:MoaA/NifB/PqqE/SkfB family radical SAM enzyme